MRTLIGDAARGAVAGAVGTWLMDQVTTAMLAAQPKDVTAREQAVRPKGQQSAENLADLIVDETGASVSSIGRSRAATALHWGLGALPGAIYAPRRHRVPLIGAARGLVFGVLLWAVNDEALNAKLGLSAPPEAYPPETHARGLVGHLVLGATTDTVLDVLGA